MPTKVTGQAGLRCVGVASNVFEDHEVVLEFGHLEAPVVHIDGEVFAVSFPFSLQSLSRFIELKVSVNLLHQLLQADRDEEADDDGGQVNKETLPGVNGFVRGVNVEHGYCL